MFICTDLGFAWNSESLSRFYFLLIFAVCLFRLFHNCIGTSRPEQITY